MARCLPHGHFLEISFKSARAAIQKGGFLFVWIVLFVLLFWMFLNVPSFGNLFDCFGCFICVGISAFLACLELFGLIK